MIVRFEGTIEELAQLGLRLSRMLELEKTGDDEDYLVLLRKGQTIPAIKLCRERTGMQLKEAKDYIEALRIKYGVNIGAPNRFT